jgi:hypothetical protein
MLQPSQKHECPGAFRNGMDRLSRHNAFLFAALDIRVTVVEQHPLISEFVDPEGFHHQTNLMRHFVRHVCVVLMITDTKADIAPGKSA